MIPDNTPTPMAIGDRVIHPKYGLCTIQEIGLGLADIEFDQPYGIGQIRNAIVRVSEIDICDWENVEE